LHFQPIGFAPFLFYSLSRTQVTLRQVAQSINQISDPATQANLIAASAILAGLRLEDEVIYRLLRKDIMQESTIYRSIQEETEAKAKREIAVNLLRRGVAIEIIAPSINLSIEEVQQLQQQMNNSVQD
jgi:predicted transposase YdaD